MVIVSYSSVSVVRVDPGVALVIDKRFSAFPGKMSYHVTKPVLVWFREL